MEGTAVSSRIYRFGPFELSVDGAELRKNGIHLKLQDQPVHILCILLEHPGEIVTREQICQQLWPEGTFVDFEHGLNTAINKIRDVLSDDADNPRYIETIPRKGYRFIAPLTQTCAPVESDGTEIYAAAVTEAPASVARRHEAISRRTLAVVAIAFLLLAIGGLLGYIRWKAHRAGTASAIRSLAVLPLQDISNHAETEYFSDGMTEALITELGKIRALRVISHHSVMKYKDGTKPVPEIAKELNVDGVVEGGVLLDGQQVRITVQLIAANPEQHLWAESYERDLRDVISLQREVARDIAGRIKITTLTPAEQAQRASARPVNIEAYNAYLQGRYSFGRLSEENVAKAIAYYEQAVELDPTYAPAWASLGEAREFQAGSYGTSEGCGKARDAAQRALALDPNLAQAHVAMGNIQMYCDWDWSHADASYQKALAVDHGNVQALVGAAALAATLGRFEQALEWNRRAVEVNPLDASAWHNLGLNADSARRRDEADAAFAKAVELNPHQPWSHAVLASIDLAKSRPQDALEEAERETHPVFRLQGMASAYHALGRKKESNAALAELITRWQRQAAFQIAEVYAFRGEADPAFRWLEKAYSQRDAGLPLIKGSAAFRKLKNDPRYAAFLRRMNLPQ